MYDEIVSWENICQAYLDLYKKFVEKSKGHNYRGIDGQNLFDAEINIDNLLKKDVQIKNIKYVTQKEMENFLTPKLSIKRNKLIEFVSSKEELWIK